jgi:hypothetical protein
MPINADRRSDCDLPPHGSPIPLVRNLAGRLGVRAPFQPLAKPLLLRQEGSLACGVSGSASVAYGSLS